MQDLLVDEGTLTDEVEKRSSSSAIDTALKGALERLPDNEQFIIKERFLSGKKKTLREVSLELKVSREWARKMEIRALDSIRRTLGREFDIRDLSNY
jgi:DNA-directed RNA polymerase sigma subunit (sigma70/sigma32)